LDADGKALLSRRVANDEPELLKLIGDVLDLADGRQVTWAIDMTGGEPALLLALLINHGQEVLYLPGRLVNRASDGYRGEGKSDARDAYVIADHGDAPRRDTRMRFLPGVNAGASSQETGERDGERPAHGRRPDGARGGRLRPAPPGGLTGG
jgi:hypothetical protein